MKNSIRRVLPFTLLSAIAFLSMIVMAMQAWSMPLPEDVCMRRTLKSTGDPKDVPLWEVKKVLYDMYNVPICYELPSSSHNLGLDPIKNFQIKRNETLQHALDQIAENNPAFEWRRIFDSIILKPKKSRGLEIENNLDVRVSLKLENVSASEAFKILQNEANRNHIPNITLDIYPGCLDDMRRPPKDFEELKTITMKLENVTVREAVCAISKASQFEIIWIFGPLDSIQLLSLGFYREEKLLQTEKLSFDEYDIYIRKYVRD